MRLSAMRIGYVSLVFASIIYLLDGLELPLPVVKATGRQVSISFPGQLDGIDSIFFQTALVGDECESSNYAYISQSPWKTKLKLKKIIETSAKVRVQTLVECKQNITAQTSVYKINGNGIGELVDDAKHSVTSSDLEALNAKCKPPPTSEIAFRNGNMASGKLIFEDNFDNSQRLTDNWVHEVRYRNWGSHPEFVAFVSDPVNSNITANKLHITMTEGHKQGNYLLVGCTGKTINDKRHKECGEIKHNIFPNTPRTRRSANLYSKISFKYGRVEIRAQMARGDWLYPNIFLETNSTRMHKDQIRLYARGNDMLQDKNLFYFDGRSLFGSVVVWNKIEKYWKSSEHWTVRKGEGQYFWEGFHDYTIIWQKDSITFKVDGILFGVITNATLLEHFNKHESYIVLGLTAGGDINFDDDVLEERHKPFTNNNPKAEKKFCEDFNLPGKIHTPLIIDHIRVYAIDKNDK